MKCISARNFFNHWLQSTADFNENFAVTKILSRLLIVALIKRLSQRQLPYEAAYFWLYDNSTWQFWICCGLLLGLITKYYHFWKQLFDHRIPKLNKNTSTWVTNYKKNMTMIKKSTQEYEKRHCMLQPST